MVNSSTDAVSRGPRVRRQARLPESIRRVSPPFDYVDVFTATTDAAALASPERWARAGVEDAAGSAGQLIWRRILGLRFDGHPSPERIGGWTIAERGDDWIRLEARSWCLTAHILVRAGRSERRSRRSSAMTVRRRPSCGRDSPSPTDARCPGSCGARSAR